MWEKWEGKKRRVKSGSDEGLKEKNKRWWTRKVEYVDVDKAPGSCLALAG